MTELDQAIIAHARYLVLIEHRPCSFLDFLPEFEVNGKMYSIDYGTLRNKFSKLARNGEIELDYRTKQAFYTIKGHKFGRQKLMTTNPLGVSPLSNDPISKIISLLPFGKNALHDIHLRFEVKGIWTLVATNSAIRIGPFNKDLRLPNMKIKDLLIKLTLHRSDTVSVIVRCSYAPIAIDCSGIIRLSNALTRAEERISRLVDYTRTQGWTNCSNGALLQVPEHGSWVVTMWHFGVDSLTEYTSDKFCVSWDVGEDALIRAYTKDMNEKRTRVRLERQEYPNKNFADAIEEKLNSSTRMDTK